MNYFQVSRDELLSTKTLTDLKEVWKDILQLAKQAKLFKNKEFRDLQRAFEEKRRKLLGVARIETKNKIKIYKEKLKLERKNIPLRKTLKDLDLASNNKIASRRRKKNIFKDKKEWAPDSDRPGWGWIHLSAGRKRNRFE